MHPGQAMRIRREKAEREGSMVVHRYGKRIATLSLGEPQGTRRVRPWVIRMEDGRTIDGGFYIGPAEKIAINQAIHDEAR